jgi:hypothetical protein
MTACHGIASSSLPRPYRRADLTICARDLAVVQTTLMEEEIDGLGVPIDRSLRRIKPRPLGPFAHGCSASRFGRWAVGLLAERVAQVGIDQLVEPLPHVAYERIIGHRLVDGQCPAKVGPLASWWQVEADKGVGRFTNNDDQTTRSGLCASETLGLVSSSSSDSHGRSRSRSGLVSFSNTT